MMVDGMWMTNVTCPRCRHRHPAELSCEAARSYAAKGVTAEAVSALRAATDEPMMDCKRALVACDGDVEKAKEWLRVARRPGNDADRLAALEADVAAIKRKLGMDR